MSVPIEAVRVASLPSWFLDVIRKCEGDDEDVFRFVNNGIPARMATAVDQKVMSVIKACGGEVQKIYDATADFVMNDKVKDKASGNLMASGIESQRLDKTAFLCKSIANQFERCNVRAFRVRPMVTKRKFSAMMDTGANCTLMHEDKEHALKNAKRSKLEVQAAWTAY